MKENPKKKSSPLFLGVLVVLVLCGLCFIVALPLSRGQPLFPTSPAQGPEARAQKYADEYNGSYDAYLAIFKSNDCAFLQGQFDLAYQTSQTSTPGSVHHKRAVGFMTASDERMQEIDCYGQ